MGLTHQTAYATVNFGDLRKLPQGRETFFTSFLWSLAGRLGAIFLQTGWVARVVLLILLFLSLFSWAIILQKYRMFATLEPRTKRFMQLFRTGRGLPDPNTLRAARAVRRSSTFTMRGIANSKDNWRAAIHIRVN